MDDKDVIIAQLTEQVHTLTKQVHALTKQVHALTEQVQALSKQVKGLEHFTANRIGIRRIQTSPLRRMR